MKWLLIVFPLALTGQLALSAAPVERDPAQPNATAPVLRSSEPSDSVMLTLPGAPVPAPAASIAAPPPALPKAPLAAPKVELAPKPGPAPKPAQALVQPVEAAARREPPKSPVEQETHAIAKTPKPVLPPDFAKDSSMFCQKQIGRWKVADARSILGEPLRRRLAYDDDKTTVNGRIYAFSDPSGRYKELELDFDKTTGNLRTVFGYPPQMTWQECLRLWGDKVAAADARQGRTFYSYLDRRLDVLVDPQGNVISLGLY